MRKSATISRRAALVILSLIIVAGVGLRAYQLTARSLWFDEAFSWRLIEFPFADMIKRAAADVHPPLYYIVLKGWAAIFGSSLFSLRSFSVLASGASIAAAYVLSTTAWRNRPIGLLAASLLAFSGWQIAFAWEARMYTLAVFLALISSWLLLRATRSMRLTTWVVYGVAAAALAYVHYIAFFTLAAQALFVVAKLVWLTRWRVGEMLQSRILWYGVISAVIAMLLYLPWLPTFIAQNSQVQQGWWPERLTGWSVPDTVYRMFLPTAGAPGHNGMAVILTMLPLLLTLAGWIILLTVRKYRDANWFVVLAGIIPFLFTMAFSFGDQSIYNDRFLVLAHVFILIGFSRLIFAIPFGSLRRAAVALILAWFVFSYVSYWRELDIPNKPGAQAAAALVFAEKKSTEPILVSSPFVFFAIDYYAREHGADTTPRLYGESAQLLHFAGGPIQKEEDRFTPAQLQAGDISSFWMIDTTGFGGSKAVLPRVWQPVQTAVFPEVFVHQGEVFVTRYVRL